MSDNYRFDHTNKNASPTNGKKIAEILTNTILAALDNIDPSLYPNELFITYETAYKLSQLKTSDKQEKEALKLGYETSMVKAKDNAGNFIETGRDEKGDPIYQMEEKRKNKGNPVTGKTETNYIMGMLYAAYIDEIEPFYKESDDIDTIKDKITNNVSVNKMMGISSLIFSICDSCDTKLENKFYENNHEVLSKLFKAANISTSNHGHELLNDFLRFLNRMALNIANQLSISSKRFRDKKDADTSDQIKYNSATTRCSLTPKKIIEHLTIFDSCFGLSLIPDIHGVFNDFYEDRSNYESELKTQNAEEKERKKEEKTTAVKPKVSEKEIADALNISNTPNVEDPANVVKEQPNKEEQDVKPPPKTTRRRPVRGRR
jgi:hypothetical protein